jgi:hypothetical protein
MMAPVPVEGFGVPGSIAHHLRFTLQLDRVPEETPQALASLLDPAFLLGVRAGPCAAHALYFIKQGGKVQKNGQKTRIGGLRSISVAMCMHNSIGMHLFIRFTICKEDVPPLNSDAWYAVVMWPARANAQENIGYNAAASQLKCARGATILPATSGAENFP